MVDLEVDARGFVAANTGDVGRRRVVRGVAKHQGIVNVNRRVIQALKGIRGGVNNPVDAASQERTARSRPDSDARRGCCAIVENQ